MWIIVWKPYKDRLHFCLFVLGFALEKFEKIRKNWRKRPSLFEIHLSFMVTKSKNLGKLSESLSKVYKLSEYCRKNMQWPSKDMMNKFHFFVVNLWIWENGPILSNICLKIWPESLIFCWIWCDFWEKRIQKFWIPPNFFENILKFILKKSKTIGNATLSLNYV